MTRAARPVLFVLLMLPARGVCAQQTAAPAPPPEHTAFAGTTWGDTRAVVDGKLRAAQFTGVAGADEDVPVYRGAVFGVTALVLPTFDGGGRLNLLTTLVKAGPDSSMMVYDQLVALLSGKYGTPSNVVRQYSPPYAAGAPRTAEGIASGAVRLSASWALRNELIVASIGRTHDVVVSYQPVGAQPAPRDLF